MPIHKRIRCSVVVASRKLDEYEDKQTEDSDNQDVITRYIDIDGTRGQNFMIEVQALPDFSWSDPSFTHITCFCKVDGQSLLYAQPFHQLYPIAQIRGSKYAQFVKGVEYEFTKEMFFSQLDIVSESSGLEADIISDSKDPRIQSLGRIEVSLYRTTPINHIVACAPHTQADVQNSFAASIHEKATKGKSTLHSVQLGDAKQVPKTAWSHHNYLDTYSKPFIMFVFLYRTRTYLDNMGIIPHVPFHSEIRSPVVSSQAGDNLKTREELLAEVQALRGRLTGFETSSRSGNIKRERSSEGSKAEKHDSTKSSKKVKATVTRLTQHNDEIEIIDLTGDDE